MDDVTVKIILSLLQEKVNLLQDLTQAKAIIQEYEEENEALLVEIESLSERLELYEGFQEAFAKKAKLD